MTDTPEKTPEEIIAEAAAAVQGAEPVKAAEAPAAVEPSPEAALDPQDAPEEAEEPEAAPVYNPNALRGVPAGPAPHPRTV